jgi:zinc protease
MKRPFGSIAGLALAGVCAVSVLLPRPAAAQPLPTDQRLTTGQLENGLHYIILPHNVPPGRVEMYVHMGTGSLNETDHQRGIAHYLEHMAFNGSKNFPPGSVIPFFQSMGMQFGRDQNAFTNMHETSFQLSLPANDKETVGKGLLFFSDVVGRLSLIPKEIDDERQIIQEERRRSLGGNERTGRYVMERIAPGSIFGQRITIGTEETINGVHEQDFKDYYGKWYGAGSATLIIVGDVRPEDVVPIIKDKFGDLPKKEMPPHQQVGIKAQDKPYAIVASDPEITSARLEIDRIDVPRGPAKTLPQLRTELVEGLSEACFNTRMGDKVSRGGTSYLNVGASMGESSNVIRESSLSIACEPAKWKDALSDGAMELQRARKYGFTQHELEDAKKRVRTAAERAVKIEGTTPSGVIIRRINSEVGSGEPVMSAAQRLQLLEEILPTITVDEVSAYFAKEMEPRNAAFIAVLPSTADVPTEAKFLEMGLAALKVEPKPEAEVKTADKLMDTLPKPGTVTESAVHEATGVWSGWLSNNVRVHHKFMDQRKDQVTVSISLIGGEMLETAENRGITAAASLPLGREHATSKLSSVDIRELMTGKNVTVGGAGGGGHGGRGGGGGSPDGLNLAVAGSADDLEFGMQLAYLLLTDAKIEDAAFNQWKTREVEGLEASLKTAAGYGVRAAASIIFPKNEAKTQPPTVEEIQRIDKAAAQAWLDKLLATSPIEVTIVGDLSREKAIELATKYLGALPSRERVSENTYMSQRRFDRPKGNHRFEETIKSNTPQAFVMVGFYGTDEKDLADVRALNMASRVLSTRMIDEIREKAQLVYSIQTGSSPATIFPGFGIVQAGATTDPDKVTALVAKIQEMYATFAKDGCTDDELSVAKGQFAKLFEEQLIEPAYWLGRLERVDFHGRSMDDIVAAPAAYQAITAQQVKAAFSKYFLPDTVFVVAVKPEKGGQAKGAEKGEEPGGK